MTGVSFSPMWFVVGKELVRVRRLASWVVVDVNRLPVLIYGALEHCSALSRYFNS